MEGNQVGKTDAAAPTRAADFDMNDLLWPSPDFVSELAPLIDTTRPKINPDDELVWPDQFSHEPSPQKPERTPLRLGTILALGVFIMATFFAIALGPVQLILLASTGDYDFVVSTYYPAVLRITLLSSGIFMATNIAALVYSLHNSKRQVIVSTIFCTGSIVLFAVAWLAAFVIELQPNQLAIIVLPLILIFWFAALMVSKSFLTASAPSRTLRIFMIILMVCSGLEIIFDGIYIFHHTEPETSTIDLAEFISDEAAARLDNVPEQLSKFTFALCQGPYDTVVFDEKTPTTGLFECQDSHEVYSVTDPNISQESNRFAYATYLGQTYNENIETYFPDAYYIYRDLSGSDPELPNELILLLPSDAEETLVDQNLTALAALTAANPDLKVNVFYTDPLDPKLTTRDYILTTAVGTIALVDWLPHGKVFTGADTPNEAIRYNFSLDRALTALSTLGMDPSAYSSQTRNALTDRRHLRFNTKDLDPTDSEILREQLLASFVDPA